MKFEELQLPPELLRALHEINIDTPTEIQEQAIPQILNSPNSNLMAQAKTGSGKTLAFSIPLVMHVDPTKKQVQAVILVPTRELCKQTYDVIAAITKYQKVQAVEVYGGVSIERQIALIMDGAQIVIATPGRLIDIFQRDRISFKHVKFVVLDEADRMLDMGFYPDIEYLLLTAMRGVQPRLMLFSATLTSAIKDLAMNFVGSNPIAEIDVSKDEMTVENCHQYYYMIDEFNDKYYHFVRILRQTNPTHSIIFVNTKRTAEWLYNRLIDEKGLKLKLELIQGDLSQNKREQVLSKFREQKINCLIATDVAARGLDIPEISHVFNYDIPEFEDNYVHRIGRTSRMDRPGTAISLCLKDQYNFLCRIEGFMRKDITQLQLPPREGKGNAPQGERQSARPSRPPRSPRQHTSNENPQPSTSDDAAAAIGKESPTPHHGGRRPPPRNEHRSTRSPDRRDHQGGRPPHKGSRPSRGGEKKDKGPDRRSFLY
jgi:ATP-dependent RNA helicase DeaD